MASPAQPGISTQRRHIDAAEFRKQGFIAGLFGAFLLAAWFLYVDTIRGNPLFTPTLFARAILSLGTVGAPETVRGSLALTLFFTVVHAAAFGIFGLLVAEVLSRFARVRSRALIALLIWGVLCIAFFAFTLSVAVVGPGALAMRDALLGNLFAAIGMTAYLVRNLPRDVLEP
jgi:hypothetical protein